MEKFSEVLEKIRILLVENEITKEEFDHNLQYTLLLLILPNL